MLTMQVLYCLRSTSSPFYFDYFGDGGLMNYLPGLALNHHPPDLSLISTWDYRCCYDYRYCLTILILSSVLSTY
jgi:hypothetical protein